MDTRRRWTLPRPSSTYVVADGRSQGTLAAIATAYQPPTVGHVIGPCVLLEAIIPAQGGSCGPGTPSSDDVSCRRTPVVFRRIPRNIGIGR